MDPKENIAEVCFISPGMSKVANKPLDAAEDESPLLREELIEPQT